MSTTFKKCSLYLYPENFSTLEISSVISGLEKISLIAQQIDGKQFYVGEKYLDYIAYMGCAPTIQFEVNDDNENFCYIKIHHYDKKQLIVSKTQARAPLCPVCNKPVKNWKTIITDKALLCESCKHIAGIEDYNWRKMGGFAQLFIEITDIFPKEAIPQPSLLDALTKITRTDWHYFYSCQ